MKIKKEFIPLILNGDKKCEFRNSKDKGGFYRIENEMFQLKFAGVTHFELSKTTCGKGKFRFGFGERVITQQEYAGIENNLEYFYDEKIGDYEVYVYEGKKMGPASLEVLEAI